MKALRTSVATAVALVSLTVSATGLVAADANNQPIPLEITPICANYNAGVEYWNVTNKNDDAKDLTWTNIDNGATGSFTAIKGTSYLATDVDENDPNNTTRFDSDTFNVPVQTNARHESCTDDQIALYGGNTDGSGDGSDGGNNGGDGGNTNVDGGQGAGVVAGAATNTTAAAPAAVKAPELAYTGASQVLPVAAAGVIALFTAGTAMLVRKNVL